MPSSYQIQSPVARLFIPTEFGRRTKTIWAGRGIELESKSWNQIKSSLPLSPLELSYVIFWRDVCVLS